MVNKNWAEVLIKELLGMETIGIRDVNIDNEKQQVEIKFVDSEGVWYGISQITKDEEGKTVEVCMVNSFDCEEGKGNGMWYNYKTNTWSNNKGILELYY